jgi:hypothetical protein
MKDKLNFINEEYKMLIEQRKMLVDDITFFTNAFHKSIFAVVGGSAVMGGFIITVGNFALGIFAATQVLILGGFFIMMLLLCMNVDCEYIRAIDKYIYDKYNVKTLFYQGYIRYKHVMKLNSEFSSLTFLVGILASLFVIVFIIWNVEFIIQYWYYWIIVVVELIIMFVFIRKNFIYKAKGESKYYDDVYYFLTGENEQESGTDEKNEVIKK